MDNQSALNNQQPAINNEPEKKKHPLTALAFMEIGLFEVFFVATVLLLIFGALNYFSILPVSETFPKFLSWLPKKHTQINNNAYNDFLKEYYGYRRKPLPTPTPIIQTEKARVILSDFISSNIVPSHAESLENMQFIEDTIANADKDVFYATWNSKTGTLSAILNLEPNTKTISSLSFASVYKTENTAPLSLDNAKDFSSRVFQTKLYGTWGCKEELSSTYCENFGENPNGVKIGVNVQQLNKNLQKLYLNYCEFHKDAKPMYDFKSCSLKFSKEGISP